MKVPKPLKITGRSSSITNAFIQAIVPHKPWSDSERDEALTFLGMRFPDLVCAYCGDRTSEWDHLFPLVRHKRPTGYLHEIRNLVPACGRCNHSKSGTDWQTWFWNPKANSPAGRRVLDLQTKFDRLTAFVAWGRLEPIDFGLVADPTALAEYWATLDELQSDLVAAQKLADELRPVIQSRLFPVVSNAGETLLK